MMCFFFYYSHNCIFCMKLSISRWRNRGQTLDKIILTRLGESIIDVDDPKRRDNFSSNKNKRANLLFCNHDIRFTYIHILLSVILAFSLGGGQIVNCLNNNLCTNVQMNLCESLNMFLDLELQISKSNDS